MKAVTKIFKRKKKETPQAGDSAAHEKPAATVPVAPQTRSIPTMKNQVSKPSKSNFSEFTVKSHTNEAAENALGKESQLSKVEEAVAKASSNGKAASGTKQAPETAKSAEPPPPQAVENNMRDARSSPEMPKEGREKDNYKGVSDSFKGMSTTQRFGVSDLEDTDSNLFMNHGDAYDAIPLIEQIKLPRGGISIETKAVGRVQVSYRLQESAALFREVITCPLTYRLRFDDPVVRYPSGDNQGQHAIRSSCSAGVYCSGGTFL
jgi:hypothetical protein